VKILIACALVVLAGCAQKEVKEDWTKKLIGQKGFFQVPPMIDDDKKYAKVSEFNACEPVEIKRVFNRTGSIVYYVEIVQSDKLFLVNGLGNNRLNTVQGGIGSDPNVTGKIVKPVLSNLAATLPFNPDQKKTMNNKASSMAELMCEKKAIWSGMSEKLFYFVMGYPEDVNRTVTSNTTQKQLVYPASKVNRYKKHYYYIVDGELTAVQD